MHVRRLVLTDFFLWLQRLNRLVGEQLFGRLVFKKFFRTDLFRLLVLAVIASVRVRPYLRPTPDPFDAFFAVYAMRGLFGYVLLVRGTAKQKDAGLVWLYATLGPDEGRKIRGGRLSLVWLLL